LAIRRKSSMSRRMTRPRLVSRSESAPELTPVSRVRVRVRRPRQQIVVRAASLPDEPVSRRASWARSDTPTLIGLDVRERQETLPEPDADTDTGWRDVENDWGAEARTLVAIKRRPVVLREGTDDALAEEYRRQAQAILDSGLFGPRPDR